MVSKLTWLKKPVVKNIKYGRGHLKARVVAKYTRVVDGRKKTSWHVPALDKERYAEKAGRGMKLSVKHHHDYEHMTDSPKTNL